MFVSIHLDYNICNMIICGFNCIGEIDDMELSWRTDNYNCLTTEQPFHRHIPAIGILMSDVTFKSYQITALLVSSLLGTYPSRNKSKCGLYILCFIAILPQLLISRKGMYHVYVGLGMYR